MPYKALSHEQCRDLCCVVCYLENCFNKKNLRNISDQLECLIKRYVSKDYVRDDINLPQKICDTCNRTLRHKSEDKPYRLHISEHFGSKVGRDTAENCPCTICRRVRLSGYNWRLFRDTWKAKREATAAPPPDPAKDATKCCPNCYSPIYPGSNHTELSCKSQKTKIENLVNNVDEKILRAALKRLEQQQQAGPAGDGASTSSSDSKLSFHDVDVIQHDANLNDDQLLSVLQQWRIKNGRKSVESGVREHLVEKKALFKPFFDVGPVQYEDHVEKTFFPTDILGFRAKVFEILGLEADDPDLICKLGIDKGKQWLKVTIEWMKVPTGPPPKASRRKRSDGIRSKNLKKTGRTLLLAAVRNVKEGYEDLRTLLEICQVKLLGPLMISSDFKVYNYILGLMESGCKFPCPFCEGQRITWEGKSKLRSFKRIGDLAKKFAMPEKEGGGGKKRKKNGKKFCCCVEQPLVGTGADTLVLWMFAPPQLHIKLGLNKTLKMLKALWPGFEEWMKTNLHLEFEVYQGKEGNLEGNGIDKILENINRLESAIPPEFAFFIACLRAFLIVKEACFGCYKLAADYKEKIADFKKTLDTLNAEVERITAGWEKPPAANVGTKFHSLIEHVPDFCDHFGLPLGVFSEQGLEKIHQTFAKLWTRFMVKCEDNIHYGPELLKCCLLLNYEQVMC